MVDETPIGEGGNVEVENRKLSKRERRNLKKQKIMEEKLAENRGVGVEKFEEKPPEAEFKEDIQEEKLEEEVKKETIEKPAVDESVAEKEAEEKKTKEGSEIEVGIDKIETEETQTSSEKEIGEHPIEEAPTEAKEIYEEQIEVKEKSRNAIIEDVKIAKLRDLWKKKPKRLSLETDAIIITLKTFDEKIIKETFYTHLDSGNKLLRYGRTSTVNQQNFIKFLQRYNLAENLENYNMIDISKEWKGKSVEIDENDKIVVVV